MDRQTVYPGAIPLDTDILSIQRNAMVALGYLAQATFGQGTVADGLACTPTSPASLTVNVAQGSIVSFQTIDASAWGSLAADAHALVKVGINAEGPTPFTLTAPGTSGQSINYLIEASFLESDTTPVVLPYYNASNPAQPYSGPGNTGTAQNTQRIQRVQLQLKAGTAANTGTQTTPAVDAGWIGLWVVTVNFGQSTITSAAIAEHPAAPFVPYKLPNLAPGFTNETTFGTAGAWSWTPPPGVVRARLHLQGAGGGGGGTSNATTNAGAGGGGGGGGYGRVVVTVTPGVAIGGAVGAGGTAGSGSGSGGTGGSTTCTGLSLTAAGGTGGAGTSTTAGAVGGAGGGITGTFDFTVAAPGGGNSQGFGSGTPQGGGTGGAPGDGRGGFNALSIGGPGNPGVFRGMGGNGGSGTGTAGNNGGAGADGYVRIEW